MQVTRNESAGNTKVRETKDARLVVGDERAEQKADERGTAAQVTALLLRRPSNARQPRQRSCMASHTSHNVPWRPWRHTCVQNLYHGMLTEHIYSVEVIMCQTDQSRRATRMSTCAIIMDCILKVR